MLSNTVFYFLNAENGVGLDIEFKSLVGSQTVPYIYEDRLNGDEVVDAMVKIFNMSEEERKKLGKLGREHVLKNYNFETFSTRWPEILDDIHKKYGSWENRKNYNSWHLLEVK